MGRQGGYLNGNTKGYDNNFSPKYATDAIIDFINKTCVICHGASTPIEDVYNKYIRYCNERGYQTTTFPAFARSFKYYALQSAMLAGIYVHKVRYMAYKEGHGYVNKSGYAYFNLAVNY